MNVDGGDDRLTAHPDVLIQNGFSSFRCQTETRSNLPNLADTSCKLIEGLEFQAKERLCSPVLLGRESIV